MTKPTLTVIKGGDALGMGLADYIWLDKEGDLRFKKRVILIGSDEKNDPVPLVERWTSGDILLVPCFYLPDPLRPQPSYIVLCEARDADDVCPEWNHRAVIREAQRLRGPRANLMWFGFEQQYVLDGEDEQDLDERTFISSERHIGACLDAGLLVHSAANEGFGESNWWFKVGYRAFRQDMDPEPPSGLTVADHLVIARYLMMKIGAGKGLVPHWGKLSTFISSPGLRQLGADLQVQTHLIEEALSHMGKTRIVPRADGRGYQCIEVSIEGSSDPYVIAVEMLESIWPTPL